MTSRERMRSQTQQSRWSNCDVVKTDGTRYFLTAVAAHTLSRTETLLVSSGVKAMEIVRRAYEVQDPPSAFLFSVAAELRHRKEHDLPGDDVSLPRVSRKEEYVLAANWLSRELEITLAEFKKKAVSGVEEGKNNTSPTSSPGRSGGIKSTTSIACNQNLDALRNRISALQSSASKLSIDPNASSPPANQTTISTLTDRVRAASATADAMISDLSVIRRVPVRSLTDKVESLMRARRRRLRWVRRIVFVLLEWMLLGAMWWVWGVVMVVRIVWRVGKGVGAAVKWFFWL